MDPIAALAAYLNQPALDRTERAIQVVIAQHLVSVSPDELPHVASQLHHLLVSSTQGRETGVR